LKIKKVVTTKQGQGGWGKTVCELHKGNRRAFATQKEKREEQQKTKESPERTQTKKRFGENENEKLTDEGTEQKNHPSP